MVKVRPFLHKKNFQLLSQNAVIFLCTLVTRRGMEKGNCEDNHSALGDVLEILIFPTASSKYCQSIERRNRIPNFTPSFLKALISATFEV